MGLHALVRLMAGVDCCAVLACALRPHTALRTHEPSGVHYAGDPRTGAAMLLNFESDAVSVESVTGHVSQWCAPAACAHSPRPLGGRLLPMLAANLSRN